jgi:hypothetical protein
LYGDHFGSPGRDDRQDGTAPQQAPWDSGEGQNPRSADDVKVAGTPTTQQPVYTYDAGPMSYGDGAEPMPDGGMEPPGAPTMHTPLEPDFEGMRRRRRSSPKMIKIAVVAAAVVVVGGGAAGAWAMTSSSSPASHNASADTKQQVQADAQAPAPLTDAQRKDAADKRRKLLKKTAVRAARNEVSRPTLYAKGTPPPKPKPKPPAGAGDPVPAGEAQQIARGMLSSFGWSPSSQFGCLVNLWNRESGWNTHASNPSGAYGIPQAKPGSKMASAGSDWQNSARTQIKWGLGYIKSRYSTPCGAWSHSQSTGWY